MRYQWGEWIQQFKLDEIVVWSFDHPWFDVARSQVTLSVRRF